MNVAKAKKCFIKQQDHSDCGVACLGMIMRYNDSDCQLERIRTLSGTTENGTTLLGLYQAAKKLGLDAEGYEAEATSNLKPLKNPAILHISLENRFNHFVVLFGWDENEQTFLIGDPAKGILRLSEPEIAKIWSSNKLLTLEPIGRLGNNNYIPKWKWFSNLIKEDYPFLLIAGVLGAVFSVLGLSTAIFSQKLVDDILPSKNLIHLILGLCFLLLLLVSRGFIGYIRGYLLNKQKREFNIRITGSFFSSIMLLPKSFFDSKVTGDLIARMNDTSRIQLVLSLIAGGTLINVLLVLVSVFYLFHFSVQLGLISLISFPLYILLSWIYNDRIIAQQKEVMVSYARTESHFIESIQGISVIKSNNLHSNFIFLTKSVFQAYQGAVYRIGRLGLSFNLYAELIAALLITSIFGYSSYLVFQKQLLIGELLGILIMTGTLIPSVVSLSLINIQIQEAKIAFERMFEFTQLKPELENDLTDDIDSFNFEKLELQNITFGFPGRVPLLNNISLRISTGEVMAINGDSGNGKSTLIQLIQRFYIAEEGVFKLNDVEWSFVSTFKWRAVLGIVNQDEKLFGGMLIDNISMSLQPEQDQVISFCKEYGFDEYFKDYPSGFYTLLGEGGVKISGGQKQLVCLARALYKKPKLLILDEATSSMDINMERFVINLLKRLKKSIAIIMIGHKSAVSEIADHSYVLTNGKLMTV